MWAESTGPPAEKCQPSRSRPGNPPVGVGGGSVSQALEVTQRPGLEALPTFSRAQSKASVSYIDRPPQKGHRPPDNTGSTLPLEKWPHPSLALRAVQHLTPYNTQHTASGTVGAQLVFDDQPDLNVPHSIRSVSNLPHGACMIPTHQPWRNSLWWGHQPALVVGTK